MPEWKRRGRVEFPLLDILLLSCPFRTCVSAPYKSPHSRSSVPQLCPALPLLSYSYARIERQVCQAPGNPVTSWPLSFRTWKSLLLAPWRGGLPHIIAPASEQRLDAASTPVHLPPHCAHTGRGAMRWKRSERKMGRACGGGAGTSSSAVEEPRPCVLAFEKHRRWGGALTQFGRTSQGQLQRGIEEWVEKGGGDTPETGVKCSLALEYTVLAPPLTSH